MPRHGCVKQRLKHTLGSHGGLVALEWITVLLVVVVGEVGLMVVV